MIRQQEKSVQSMLWMLFQACSALVVFSVVLTENLVLTAWVMGAILVLCAVLYGIDLGCY